MSAQTFSMADAKDRLVGAGKSAVSRVEDTNFSGVDCDISLRFATAAGVILFNPEDFMADVVNSVNDLILNGFDSMEEFAAEALHIRNDETRCALRNGVDKIFNKVQDNIDEHLSRWESVCRTHYFNVTSDPKTLSSSDNEAVLSRDSGDAGVQELQEQEEMLDKELCSLRSQLIAVERDSSTKRRELTLLERELALRSEFICDMKNQGHFDGGILEEVMKSATLLKNKMEKVSSLQRQRHRCRAEGSRHPSDRSVLPGGRVAVPETKLSHGSKELVELLPRLTDTTADTRLLELLSSRHSSDAALDRETASAVVNAAHRRDKTQQR